MSIENETENTINTICKESNSINAPKFSIACSVCAKPFIVRGDMTPLTIGKLLNDRQYRFVDGKLYCSTCYEQYKKLREIFNEVQETAKRLSKENYYLNIAKAVSTRSTCLRRKYGSIIVKNDIIISTGYNGAPRGTKNCIDLQFCKREQMNIPRGQCYELCRSVHSEQNAIINADRDKMIDSTLYLYGVEENGDLIENLDSCRMCKKMIINAGIKKVVFARPNDNFEEINVIDWVENDETLSDKLGY